MNNPLRILRTLDECLHAPLRLYVYGRSALALGYPDAPAAYQATMDVDAILPARDIGAIENNEDFWQAQEQVNRLLGDAGLYFTHLFEEQQVVLTPDWLTKVVPIEGFAFQHLTLSRPSTVDLILTKMMRVDPQDRDDARFLLRQSDFKRVELEMALRVARIPDVEEIRDAFAQNRAWLLAELNR